MFVSEMLNSIYFSISSEVDKIDIKRH